LLTGEKLAVGQGTAGSSFGHIRRADADHWFSSGPFYLIWSFAAQPSDVHQSGWQICSQFGFTPGPADIGIQALFGVFVGIGIGMARAWIAYSGWDRPSRRAMRK
jgi:hypothetical protein